MTEDVKRKQLAGPTKVPGVPEGFVHFKMPPFFDFNSKELEETAREFYIGGVLRAPFQKVAFETDYSVPPSENGGESDDTAHIILTVEETTVAGEDHPEHKVQIMVQRPDREYNLLGFFCIFNQHRIRMRFTNTNTLSMFLENETENQPISKWARQLMVMMLLVTNLKQFDQKEVVHSSKLQKARARRGKQPLKNYIQIALRPEYREARENGGGCDGGIRKAHWRRGHLRKLASGTVTKVSPCMVNWRGESIEPKEYRIKV